MDCISLCGTPCLCALSASAFIDSSLHQLDFFLEIFLWRLVIYRPVWVNDVTGSYCYDSTYFTTRACIRSAALHEFTFLQHHQVANKGRSHGVCY